MTLTIEGPQAETTETDRSVTVKGSLFRIGRKAGNDWCLPDSSRFISGEHLEIRAEGDGFFVRDLSTNGTFINGSKHRLTDRHRIEHDDLLKIGSYELRARLTVTATSNASTKVQAPLHATLANKQKPMPVRAPKVTLEPRPESSEPVQVPPNAAAFAPAKPENAIPVPGKIPEDPFEQPEAHDLSKSDEPEKVDADDGFPETPAQVLIPDDDFQLPGPFSDSLDDVDNGKDVAKTPPVSIPAIPAAIEPKPRDEPEDRPNDQVAIVTDEWTGAPTPRDPEAERAATRLPLDEPASEDQPENATSDPPRDPEAFWKGFLEGAGLDTRTPSNMSPEEFGRLMGRCARTCTNGLMQMLEDRSAMKLFVVQQDRTMLVARDNNPMKFMPNPDDAFDAMFVTPQQGYMAGSEAFDNALADICGHNAALIAAIQPAIAEMLEGLSPQEIAGSATRGVLGGNRKNWEEFVARWEARATHGDNGMLDIFLEAFARHYAEALKSL